MYNALRSFLAVLAAVSFTLVPCSSQTPFPISDALIQPIKEQAETDEGYHVSYRFTLADSNGVLDLGEEVMQLLPSDDQVYQKGETVYPAELEKKKVNDYLFLGWEPNYAIVEDSDIVFSGVWAFTGAKRANSILAAAAEDTLRSGFGSIAWGLHERTYTGTYNFLLGGEQAYCIELGKPVPAAGTVYTYSHDDTSKLARIIGKGTMNGMSPGAIQAAVWNYVSGDKSRAWVDSGESVDYDDAVYSGQGYSCLIKIYHPAGNNQSFAKNWGCTPVDTKGKLKVVKNAYDDYGLSYMITYPENYELAGAVYGVYSDKDCTKKVATLTTKSNGTTNEVSLSAGTYYVKEIEAPKGFRLDKEVYKVKISASASSKLNLFDYPLGGDVHLLKKAKKTFIDLCEQFPNNYSLEGAVYGIYKDESCLDQICEMTTDRYGDAKVNGLPSGTYYVKEKKPSKGFRIDESVYPALLEENNVFVIDSEEVPFFSPFAFELIKQDIRQKDDTRYLEETRFSLAYYDIVGTDVKSAEPKYTWILAPVIENGKAIVRLDDSHLVEGDALLKDEKGTCYLPLGTFTLEEIQAPQTYARDENIYVGRIVANDGKAEVVFESGEWISSNDDAVNLTAGQDDFVKLNLLQLERKVIIETTALFEITGTDRFKGDGEVTVIDKVHYDHLKPGETYLLRAEMHDKKDGSLVAQGQSEFTPETEEGIAEVKFKINFDDDEDIELVAYEYLYEKRQPDKLISCHEDINDEGQTIHRRKLYKADMVLYKIGKNKNIRLDGALFSIKIKYKGDDGKTVEKDLGHYISGGIYLEQDSPFRFELYTDPQAAEPYRTCESSYSDTFKNYFVSLTGLPQGTYYGKLSNEDELEEYQIEKGMIFLKQLRENTLVTYKEVRAPNGYYLDPTPFTANVGNDETLTRIENYRTNLMIILPERLPKTGIE